MIDSTYWIQFVVYVLLVGGCSAIALTLLVWLWGKVE